MKDFKKYNILCVEDDEDVFDIYQKLFPLIFNKVFFAKNGKEALNIFKKEDIDLVVTDALMPEMNGEELIEEIRKSSNIPIIMISAFEDKNIDNVIFLKKPINTQSLMQALKEAFR